MNNITRKKFLQSALVGAAALSVSPVNVFGASSKPSKSAQLKLSFQEGIAPGENLESRLDYMENLGIVGLELYGSGLPKRVNEIQQLLRGRDISVSAICAGYGGFILSENESVRKECKDSFKEILAAAGELGSVGVIIVPAFNGQKPALPHTLETRAFLLDELKELGEFAQKHNTSVILEPLNRGEAFVLRQVADAASICRDINMSGVTCMGDFWHMTIEEPCDMGALLCGGKHLSHVHMASRKRRSMPGEDGEADNYLAGFKALKMLNYSGFVSFECGCQGDRTVVVPEAVKLLRDQWKKA